MNKHRTAEIDDTEDRMGSMRELDFSEERDEREGRVGDERPLELGEAGRVLLRKSGTEPLVRVMVEGDDEIQVRGMAEELAKVVTEVCA